jgi:tripartite-type tricarboxylate transporter receptor subunit TctC
MKDGLQKGPEIRQYYLRLSPRIFVFNGGARFFMTGIWQCRRDGETWCLSVADDFLEKMEEQINRTKLACIALLSAVAFSSGVYAKGAAPGAWKWERKVSFISPWGPGGGSGPTIRNIVPLVREVIGVPAEVQHVEGAGGANGAVFAERQPADGYTYLLATQSQIILDLQKTLPYDFKTEFIPIAKLVHSTNGLMASAKAMKGKYTDFKSFIAYAKAHPRELSCAMLSAGGTDAASLTQELALSFGVPMNQVGNVVKIVSYGGGSEIDAALVGGHVHVAVAGSGDEAGLIESGDVVPLVVFAEKRMHSFPDIPTTGEMGIAAYIAV